MQHLMTKDQRLLRTRWRRLIEAVGQDALDSGRKLIGTRTFDAAVEVGQEIVDDIRSWWDRRDMAQRDRRADAMSSTMEVLPLIEDQAGGDDIG